MSCFDRFYNKNNYVFDIQCYDKYGNKLNFQSARKYIILKEAFSS